MRFIAFVVAALAGVAQASELPREARVPGGIALIEIAGGAELQPTVLTDTRRAAVIRHNDRWLAIVGIPLSAKPGTQKLRVTTGAKTVEVPFQVTDKQYRTQS